METKVRQNWDWQRDYTLIGMVLPAGLGGAGWWAATEWVRAIEWAGYKFAEHRSGIAADGSIEKR